MGTLIFDVMWYDRRVAHVEVHGSVATAISFEKDYGINPFANTDIDPLYVDYFIRSRCFEEANASKDFFLEYMGLDSYDPYKIVRITHGVMCEDYTWIRFDGEDLEWKDVKHGRV